MKKLLLIFSFILGGLLMIGCSGSSSKKELLTDLSDEENNKPIAKEQNVTLYLPSSKTKSKSITLSGTDEDNDTLRYRIITQPKNGTLKGTAPNLIYTPKKYDYGNDSFTFKVNDGKNDSEVAKVNITIREFKLLTKKEDLDADGVFDYIKTYTYDKSGRSTKFTIDDNADEILDAVGIWTYDDKKHLTTYTYDSDMDGKANNTHTTKITTNNSGDKLIITRTDNDGDGTMDEARYRQFDSQGRLISESDDYEDDGYMDYVIRISYNENNKKISQIGAYHLYDLSYETWRYRGDKKIEYIYKTRDMGEKDWELQIQKRFIYDTNNKVKDVYVTDNSFTPHKSIYRYTYDDRGNLLTYKRDKLDGSTYWSAEYFYDKNDNLLAESINSDGIGTVESNTMYTYDKYGNLLEINRNTTTEDKITTFTWQLF